jgi:endonuclease/exonuclease/phosphatase family metal-dependent hydrolase
MDRGLDRRTGSFVEAAEKRALSNATLRVATWNIRGGVGLDRRFDLNRIIATLQRAEPDVVALQEVDSRRNADATQHPFVLLRQALGAHAVEAKSIIGSDGDYGQLLISRWPLSAIHIHDISVDRHEPRRAIEATVHAPGGDVRIVATHLGLRFGERRRQTRKLVELARMPAATTIMLGDFNDWIWRGSVQNEIHRALPDRTWQRTFPSWLPLIRLDRIYCRPRGALVHFWTDQSARVASDHLPLFADVALSA